MKRLLALLALAASPVLAQESAPSGQTLVVWEIRWERLAGTSEVQMILRALAPDLGETGYEAAQGDMDWLCANQGVALAGLAHSEASQIVVNLADRPVARGATDPEATQFFSVYLFQEDRCISEDF